MERNRKQLYFAIFIFVIAVVGVKMFIDMKVKQSRPGGEQQVVIASTPLTPGTVITKKALKKKIVPKNYMPVGAVKWNEADTLIGQQVSVNVPSGEYILESYFTAQRTVSESLSGQIDNKLYRAITLPVDQTNSLARSIKTGDKIDILFSFSVPQSSEKMSVVLFQAVPVIATGSYAASEQELGTYDDKVKQYGTLTLKLTAQDAFRLSYARQAGKIGVMLRNAGDSDAVEISPIFGVVDVLEQKDKERVMQLVKETTASQDVLQQQIKEIFDTKRKVGNQSAIGNN